MSSRRAEPVEAFAECARSYCELVDSLDEIGRGGLVWEAGARLARLYAAGHDLPVHRSERELVDSEVTPAEKERRDELQQRLSLKLEGVDLFWLVHDPYDPEGLDPEDVAEYVPAEILQRHRHVLERERLTPEGVPEPVCSILSDVLMDVYGDVKDGLSLHDAGERESAVWEWRFGFQHAWGIEAAEALAAIHWLTHASGARSVERDEP